MGFGNYKRISPFIALALLAFTPKPSYADCVSPAATAGEMGFDLTGKGIFEYCNDSNWTSMDAGTANAPQLIGHWKLDETSGSTLTDSSGNGHTGTWTDGVNNDTAEETTTDSANGAALTFDGADNTVNVGTPEALNNVFNSGGTMAVWFKANSSGEGGYGRLIEKAIGSGANSGWSLTLMNGPRLQLWREYSSGDGKWGNINITFGQWHHLVIAYNDSDPSNDPVVYLDGSLFAPSDSNSSGTPDDDSAANLTIGNSNAGDRAFDGIIDDVRFYDGMLNASQVTELYEATKLPSPVGHWKLDETSGSNIVDSSSSGNDGTWDDNDDDDVSGETTTGKIGTAINFDGTDDHIIAGSIPELLGATNFTMTGWMKRDAAGNYVHFGVDDGASGTTSNSIGLFNDGNIYFSVNIGGYAYGRTSLNDTDWHHVAMIYDGTGATDSDKIKGYIDGEEVTLSYSGTIPAAAHSNAGYTMKIGRYGSYYTNGSIDDVRIYDSALTTTQIETLYNQTHPHFSNLIGHWKMDDTSGATITDSSGNGVHGTWDDSVNNDVAEETTAGQIGTAIAFDGTNDFVTVDDIESIDGKTEATICTWVYYTGDFSTDAGIIGKIGGSSNGWYFWIDEETNNSGVNNTISFAPTLDGSNFRIEGTASLVTQNQWDHYCGVYSASTFIRLYKNGILDNENTSQVRATVQENTEILEIGTRNDGLHHFDGYLDDLRIYDRALSADEIYALARKCAAGGVMYHDFTDHVTRFCDSTGAVRNVGAPGAGGGGCAAGGALIAGAEGAMQYDTANNKMVFCDGANWVDIAN